MQLDIAVALSQSASEANRASADAVREEDDVARAKRLSLTPGQASSAAEALSCKLWQTERCHLLPCLFTHPCYACCVGCSSQSSTGYSMPEKSTPTMEKSRWSRIVERC